MRIHALLSIALLCLALLSGCGNGNDGSGLLNRKKNSSSASTTNPVQAGVNAPLKLKNCANFTVFNGSNTAFAEQLSGSSICRVDAAYPIVQLKVGMNFPKSGRFCLVPTTDYALPETCFSPTDAMVFNLDASASAMGSIVLLAESDLALYKSYLNFQTNTAPPRALALMPQ